MNLQNIFIPYAESLELKNLGFDEECLGYYLHPILVEWKEVKSQFQYPSRISRKAPIVRHQKDYPEQQCSAPTWEHCWNFFQDKYKLYSYIEPVIVEQAKSPLKFDYVILEVDGNEEEYNNFPYHTYEEARLECLRKLIEIVKTQKL